MVNPIIAGMTWDTANPTASARTLQEDLNSLIADWQSKLAHTIRVIDPDLPVSDTVWQSILTAKGLGASRSDVLCVALNAADAIAEDNLRYLYGQRRPMQSIYDSGRVQKIPFGVDGGYEINGGGNVLDFSLPVKRTAHATLYWYYTMATQNAVGVAGGERIDFEIDAVSISTGTFWTRLESSKVAGIQDTSVLVVYLGELTPATYAITAPTLLGTGGASLGLIKISDNIQLYQAFNADSYANTTPFAYILPNISYAELIYV